MRPLLQLVRVIPVPIHDIFAGEGIAEDTDREIDGRICGLCAIVVDIDDDCAELMLGAQVADCFGQGGFDGGEAFEVGDWTGQVGCGGGGEDLWGKECVSVMFVFGLNSGIFRELKLLDGFGRRT